MKPSKILIRILFIAVFAMTLAFPASALEQGKYYADEGSISYWEAVDTLTMLGVLKGRGGESGGQGRFEPRGTLTRAEAAKICVFLAMGARSAESAAEPAETEFADVPEAHWASGYIGYCAREGIIHGSSPSASSVKYFLPEEPVTGYEMLKLVLGALGYGVNGEFTGENWSIRVAYFADLNRLTAGIAMPSPRLGVYDSPAYREEAALYTFNALKANTVRWNPRTGRYEPLGASNNTLLEWVGGNMVLGVVSYDEGFVVYGLPMGEETDELQIPAENFEYHDLGRRAHVYYILDSDGSVRACSDAYFDDTLLVIRSDGAGLSRWTDSGDPAYTGFSCGDKLRWSVNGSPYYNYVQPVEGISLAEALDLSAGDEFLRGSVAYLIDSDGGGTVDTVHFFVG